MDCVAQCLVPRVQGVAAAVTLQSLQCAKGMGGQGLLGVPTGGHRAYGRISPKTHESADLGARDCGICCGPPRPTSTSSEV